MLFNTDPTATCGGGGTVGPYLLRFLVRLMVNRIIFFKLELWANAQRDGRPAEYKWRSLFNAAKFG